MERNDIENIKSNQSKQRSYRGAKRSGRGGAHGGAPALHPSPFIRHNIQNDLTSGCPNIKITVYVNLQL